MNKEITYLRISIKFLSTWFGLLYVCFLLGSIYSFHVDFLFLLILGIFFLVIGFILRVRSWMAINGTELIIRSLLSELRINVKDIKELKKTNIPYVIGMPEVILVDLNSNLSKKTPTYIQPYLYSPSKIEKFIEVLISANPKIQKDSSINKFFK